MQSSPNRTVREFYYGGDLWSAVDAWAAETGYRLQRQEESLRLYRKGIPLLMAPAVVEISQNKGRVTIQAWVKADPYLFLAILTGRTPEMAVDSGGLTATIPRKKAREAVNRLLKLLGQKEIG